jgi:hypothetical protein
MSAWLQRQEGKDPLGFDAVALVAAEELQEPAGGALVDQQPAAVLAVRLKARPTRCAGAPAAIRLNCGDCIS